MVDAILSAVLARRRIVARVCVCTRPKPHFTRCEASRMPGPRKSRAAKALNETRGSPRKLIRNGRNRRPRGWPCGHVAKSWTLQRAERTARQLRFVLIQAWCFKMSQCFATEHKTSVCRSILIVLYLQMPSAIHRVPPQSVPGVSTAGFDSSRRGCWPLQQLPHVAWP